MKKVVMTEPEVIKSMKDMNYILAVDFTKIQHLGVYEKRRINCVLYTGSARFNPKVYCEFVLTEQQISNVIDKFIDGDACGLWSCDDSEFFSPKRTRYFSVNKPQSPFWDNPMSKDV